MTKLKKWYDNAEGIYTCDTWVIPENGTDIWCTAWKRGQTIKPYGDGCHVIVGLSVYHCNELMGILQRLEKEGYTWGLDGVKMTRQESRNGRWVDCQ